MTRHPGPAIARGADGLLQIGFNDFSFFNDEATAEENVALHRGVGSTVVRFHMLWHVVQPEREAAFCFEPYDAYLDLLRQAGIRPVIVIASAPPWTVTEETFAEAVRLLTPTAPDPAFDTAWQEYAAAIAQHVPWAAGIEVWNEPNHHGFWLGPKDPARYADLLASAYEGVKAVVPEMPIIAGSLTNSLHSNQFHMGVREFIDGMFRYGAAGRFDAFSFHPYPVFPLDDDRQLYAPSMAIARDALAAHQENCRFWITEVGISTTAGVASAAFTADAHAKTLRLIYDDFVASGDVDLVLFHTLVEPTTLAEETGFGWVKRRDESGRFPRKRVYDEFAAVLGAVPDDAVTLSAP